jgi:hypothetical protein
MPTLITQSIATLVDIPPGVATVHGLIVAGAPLSAYINAIASPTSATLGTNASTTVTNVTGGMPYTIDGIHISNYAKVQIETSSAFDLVTEALGNR